MVQESIFLRFGLWPSNEKSQNFLTFHYEEGVSCYPARIDKYGCATIDKTYPFNDDMYKAIRGRKVYPVLGVVVGKGSDGEPLVRNVKHANIPVSLSVISFIRSILYFSLQKLTEDTADMKISDLVDIN